MIFFFIPNWVFKKTLVNGKYARTGSSIYWSAPLDRWVIETPDVTFQATASTPYDDNRQPHGIQAYFGSSQWTQITLLADKNGSVTITIACSDTSHPTEEPTEQPTEEPTEQPTEQPTEEPTEQPTEQPSEQPTEQPTEQPSEQPTEQPS